MVVVITCIKNKTIGEIFMYASFKNRFLVGLAVILAIVSFNNASANPKTWTKDASGRVLVYRAEPSKWEAVGLTMMSAFGGGITLGGACSVFQPKDNAVMVFCGSIITLAGAYGLWCWSHNYNSLFKPLIVMDRGGITYEGKDKILWKKISGYREMIRTIYHGNGVVTHENYLEISTDVDKFEIREYDIAITLSMLYKLIDESYKAYQELEKENAAVRA